VTEKNRGPSDYGYAPTKRGADVNDYTALEAEVAKARDENQRLRAAVEDSLRREGDLRDQVRCLEAILRVDRGKVDAYAAASAAAPKAITATTPIKAIDAALRKKRLATEIADAVVAAVAMFSPVPTPKVVP
jgi:hypothetical protein